MSTPSIGAQVMLLPVEDTDLSVIIKQQLRDAYPLLDEDETVFSNVCCALFTYIVDLVADTLFYEERWEPALRSLITDSLDDFVVQRYRSFYYNIERLKRDLCWYDHCERNIALVEAAIWEVGWETEQYVQAQVSSYQQGSHYLPRPPQQTP
jgi:hypothetical protein